MQLRRYFIAVLLLLMAAMPAVITVYFIAASQITAHKMFEQLKNEQVYLYHFSKQQVQWVKEDEELLVEGKLLDVKYSRENADSILVAGLFDEEEDDLEEKYKGFVNGKQQPEEWSLLKIFFTPFLVTTGENQTINYCTIPGNRHHNFNEMAVSMAASIITPPPQHTASI